MSLPTISWNEYIQPFMKPLSGNYNLILNTYVDEVVKLYADVHPWCHVIIKQQLVPYLCAHPKFVFSGISCDCSCTNITEEHKHLIGYFSCSPMTIRRFFSSVYKELNITTTKGSNLNYKCLQLKDFQHFITAIFYLLRVKAQITRTRLGTFHTVNHKNFTPYGDNELSNFMEEGSAIKHLWDKIYGRLTVLGHENLVVHCKSKYEEFKRQQQLQRERQRARRDHLYGQRVAESKLSLAINSLERELPITHVTAPPRAGTSKAPTRKELVRAYQHHHPYKSAGVPHPGDRVARLLQQDTLPRLANLLGSITEQISKATNTGTDWGEQLREIISGALPESLSMDNRPDRSDGLSECTRL